MITTVVAHGLFVSLARATERRHHRHHAHDLVALHDVPIPSDLATFKMPTPFASCFRTFRSVALLSSAGRASRPAPRHA
jgi:hypothetical protein